MAPASPACSPSPTPWSTPGSSWQSPLVLLGNVGEEGEGDLRGMRHLYNQPALAGRIAAHIVLDGAGADSAVTQALGSRRYQVFITGPGGHSFTDAGTPNPIAALASALAVLAETARHRRAPHHPQPRHHPRRHQRQLHSRRAPRPPSTCRSTSPDAAPPP